MVWFTFILSFSHLEPVVALALNLETEFESQPCRKPTLKSTVLATDFDPFLSFVKRPGNSQQISITNDKMLVK